MQGYLLGAILFLVAVVVFVFQNTVPVSVHFLKWISPEVSLAVVALVAACTGAIITFLVDSFRQFKIAKRIKELGGENHKLQKELVKANEENERLQKRIAEINAAADDKQ